MSYRLILFLTDMSYWLILSPITPSCLTRIAVEAGLGATRRSQPVRPAGSAPSIKTTETQGSETITNSTAQAQ